MKKFFQPVLHAAAIFSLLGSTAALASEAHAPASDVKESGNSIAEDYCANIIDKAADARTAWQLAKLQKLEKDVSDKLVLLENKQKELQEWISKREQMLKAAGRELVDIYAKMDPDAAAGQLAKLDTATATSILRQLSPRGASAILDVMEADRAAALVKAIAAATRDAAPGGGT